MQQFAHLYARLDATTKTNEKVAALQDYFAEAPAADAAWAVFFLTGRKLKRVISTGELRQWAAEAAGIPLWLFEESYHAVGDLAETVALVLPAGDSVDSNRPLAEWVTEVLLPLREAEELRQRKLLLEAWSQLGPASRFVWNKLITGGFRVGVSQQLVVRALGLVATQEPATIAHRLMGDWQPTADFYRQLMAPEAEDNQPNRPYPFYLASPWEDSVETLGEMGDFLAEWKWDGIRAQLIRRSGETFLWSRGEELITGQFPELQDASVALSEGTVLDGEILPMKEERVLPFSELQKRIGRKQVSKKLLRDVPVVFLAFDLLEQAGEDFRTRALSQRRGFLEELIKTTSTDLLKISPKIASDSWEDLKAIRQESRSRGVEGIMLKRLDSAYGVGRQRGSWWKWKVEPLSIDAVMIYAQYGHGRRASLYTDYTFGLWKNGELVPFAKAYSGLTDEEIRQVDRFVRQNTLERFGPVRRVKPELVFEIAFENIQASRRHKSGVAVRFPRMLKWRHDKTPSEADSLESLYALLPRQERP